MAKADLTRLKLLEGATRALAELGDKGTTFQSVARYCGVSHPLVVHYFKKRENIYPQVLDHIITQARDYTVRSLQEVPGPLEKLVQYLRVSLEFFRSKPEYARIYLMLYYFAGYDPKFRAINTEIKRVAVERIRNILEDGKEQGIFKVEQTAKAAKTIHNSLVGLYICALTEDHPLPDRVAIKALEELTLKYLGVEAQS